jgi:hypothetical protein
MTTSERIRAAALGPMPSKAYSLSSWIRPGPDWWAAREWCKPLPVGAGGFLRGLTPTQRRMFLLFVSEAVK